MGKHSKPEPEQGYKGSRRNEGTGRPNQGTGKHVDHVRQPSGRGPGWIDSVPDEHMRGL